MNTEGRGHVLIVDDDQDNREVFRLALEEEGFAILEAPDGIKALSLLRQSPQRLVVLLDELMPHMEGSTLLRQVAEDEALARRHAFLVVTAISRIGTLEQQISALPTISAPVISKPVDIDLLVDAVKQAAISLKPPGE